MITKSSFVTGLVILGGLSLMSGLLGVINSQGMMRTLMPDFATTLFVNSAFDLLFGMLVLISSWILAKGKTLGLWLYGSAILMNTIFNFALGHNINYFVIGLSLLILRQMVKLKAQWELA